GSRALWHRVEKEGHAKARFIICNDTSHDDDPAAVTKALKAEAKRFHDLVFLKCEEGYSHGRLTLKVLASMKYFHSRRKQMDLFMKVDDDSFVAWSRLHKLLNSLKTTSMKYIGHPLGPCNATRESNNRWYEPPDVYPNVSYPRTMAGGVGYLLGKDLIHEIMLDKEKNPQEACLNLVDVEKTYTQEMLTQASSSSPAAPTSHSPRTSPWYVKMPVLPPTAPVEPLFPCLGMASVPPVRHSSRPGAD
ncbi:unnamed protein product, partial [Prorocentrum cordatum]